MLEKNLLGELLRKAAEFTAESVLVINPNLEGNPLVYVNRGFEELTGFTKEESIGNSAAFLIGEETSTSTVETIRNAIKAETLCAAELKCYRKDKTSFWGRLAITPIRDESGQLYYVGILSDITYLIKTEMQLREMELEGKLDEERIKVLRTLMRTINDIVGNSLNSMQMVTLEYHKNGHLSDETLKKFDHVIFNVMNKLHSLSKVDEYKTTDYGGEVFDVGQTEGEKNN